jgi:pathogenesis-related protein 1
MEKVMKITMKQMLSAIFIVITLVFAADAQASKVCSGSTEITETEKRQILESHNKARAEFSLSQLTWDCELAKVAQEWATRGIFGHRPDTDFGENLFVSSASKGSPINAVQQWMLEKSYWDNSSGVCQTGKVCTHYTQIVWKKTTKVGCGINRNAPGKWKTLVVCNYDPAGNSKGPAY